MEKTVGTTNIGFVTMDYFYDPNLTPVIITASTVIGLPVALLVLAPMQLIQGNQTDIKFSFYNINLGKTETIIIGFNSKPSKLHIANHINAYLKQTKKN
jgi:hypothetical protein